MVLVYALLWRAAFMMTIILILEMSQSANLYEAKEPSECSFVGCFRSWERPRIACWTAVHLALVFHHDARSAIVLILGCQNNLSRILTSVFPGMHAEPRMPIFVIVRSDAHSVLPHTTTLPSPPALAHCFLS